MAPYGRRVNTAGGTALFIFEAGDRAAPALLLIHGLGDEADSWRHVFRPLAETHHVIAVDLPGFGRSQPIASYRLPVVAHVLLSLLDALNLPAATLVGSSMGAMLGQLLALRAPERVAGLILVGGALGKLAAPFSWPALRMALPLVGSRLYTSYRRDARAAYDSLRPFYDNLDALPAADRQFLFQRVNERVWSDTQRRAYLRLYRDLAWSEPRRQSQRGEALGKLAVPTHLVWGERDHIMPLVAAKALLELQPAAWLTTIAEAGHLPHQERPADFLRAVLSPQGSQPAGESQPVEASQPVGDSQDAGEGQAAAESRLVGDSQDASESQGAGKGQGT